MLVVISFFAVPAVDLSGISPLMAGRSNPKEL
jgi:hypothetical protein